MELRKIEEFYSRLAKEKAVSESLAKKIRDISSEMGLIDLIREEILPLSKKMGYNFSENDLLEYEKMVAQKLSPEDLLDVSGGVSLKSALLSGGIFSLAMLGFGALSPVQADAMVPKAAVESATGGVVAGAKEDSDKIFKDMEERDRREKILQRSDNQKFISNLNTYRVWGWKYKEWKRLDWTNLNKEELEAQINNIIQGSTNLKTEYETLAWFYNTFIEDAIKDWGDFTFERYQEIFNVMEDLDVALDTLQSCEKHGGKLDEINETSIRTAINTLREEAAPSGDLEAEKDMVLHSTGKVAKEAKDSQEIELS